MNEISLKRRLMSLEGDRDDISHEVHLRPNSFEEFIGQTKLIKNIEVMVKSAHLRKHAMDHTLLSGPPGLGKTSLATIIAKALQSELNVVSGPAIEKKGDLAAILTNLNPGDVLFIDEIHRIHVSVEEILYSAMEDYRLDIVIGSGPSARTMQIDLAPFTLIGATTRSGLLSNPLRDRFVAQLHFDFYNPKDLSLIIENNAKKLGLSNIDQEAIDKIANCARGTPRIANRILRRVRDFSIVKQITKISKVEVDEALNLMDINEVGLDRMDRKILHLINEYYNGGPVGIEAICATLGEDRHTVEEVFEPYLLKEGFLLRTSRGRMISKKTKEMLVDDHLIR